MSNTLEAVCTSCNGISQLSRDNIEQLQKSEPAPCSECGAMVKIKIDPSSGRKSKLSVLTLMVGAAIVAVVALINVFGDAGFPTYFVAIPFILISMIVTSSLKGSTSLKLQSTK